jgi:hypothetical protein
MKIKNKQGNKETLNTVASSLRTSKKVLEADDG